MADPTIRTFGEPSAEQWEALQAFAALHGRHWKQALRDAWMNGDYGTFADAGLLQQLRNTFGPAWLTRVDLRQPR